MGLRGRRFANKTSYGSLGGQTRLDFDQQGRRDEALRSILRILRRRFGDLPATLEARLSQVADLETLESLVEEAAVCESLAGFNP